MAHTFNFSAQHAFEHPGLRNTPAMQKAIHRKGMYRICAWVILAAAANFFYIMTRICIKDRQKRRQSISCSVEFTCRYNSFNGMTQVNIFLRGVPCHFFKPKMGSRDTHGCEPLFNVSRRIHRKPAFFVFMRFEFVLMLPLSH